MTDDNDELSGQVLLSVVLPCFNEEDVLREAHSILTSTLRATAVDYELIFIDDGSNDDTINILRDLTQSDPCVRVIALSRNFGQQIAATAGLDHADGDVIVLMDVDLQDPPALIPEMLDKWREGYDVVYCQRRTRAGETPFKLTTARQFYKLLDSLAEIQIPRDTGDFRLMDRRVLDALQRMPERDRFLRGMVSWVGFRQIGLPYDRQSRAAGVTKYSFRKMFDFAKTSILSFSSKPLRIATWVGLAISCLAALGIVYAVLMRLFTDHWVSGWTFTIVAILFMGGIQLLFLGIIGEYIARIFDESKNRPLYFVRETHRVQRRTEHLCKD